MSTITIRLSAPILDGRLTRADCSALDTCVRCLPGEWLTRKYEDRGRTIALLLPKDERDEQAPLFLIWREQTTFYLCKGQGAGAADLRSFTHISALIASMEREVLDYLATNMRQ